MISFPTIEFFESLYERYRSGDTSLDPSFQYFFQGMEFYQKFMANATSERRPIIELIQAYRTYGHFAAAFNPLTRPPAPESVPLLKIETYGFSQQELQEKYPTMGLLPNDSATGSEILLALQSTYSGAIGIEYMGNTNLDLQNWVQKKIEPNFAGITISAADRKRMLIDLHKSEAFEAFLQTTYPGQKRFSLEGCETLIPMLHILIRSASKLGAEQLVFGMAHRGRLNVLANILQKPYRDIFAEFESKSITDASLSGDVKYHKGYSCDVLVDQQKMTLHLAANPSHLESVNPIVAGFTYSKQIQSGKKASSVLPLFIHGDAAVAGQGVVYETLQLQSVDGYAVGGSIHIVINNQVGFTANAKESRSTFYCTDIAKTFECPVLHVNAYDVEGACKAVILALEVRQRFAIDVFIDLNGYRKYGHNETDEPNFTQPLLYSTLSRQVSIYRKYREMAAQTKLMEMSKIDAMEKELQKTMLHAKGQIETPPHHKKTKEHAIHKVDTRLSPAELQRLIQIACSIPKDFTINKKIERILLQRLTSVQEGENIDWATAESLAYASLLAQGISIRLSGQDAARGTFSHRHAQIVDQKTEKTYIPIQAAAKDNARFVVYNSILSEFAVMGFELGYSYADHKSLVIWEAQFGDFANGAQIIIDQYLASGDSKWMEQSRLTLLLPHGFEGQGPEHSSARIERFLQLSAGHNMQVVYPSTPSQFFHLLRKQVMQKEMCPLIVFTPKGLLRYKQSFSSISDCTENSFLPIIGELQKVQPCRRVLLCTGRVYYDLIAYREKENKMDTAIIRIEQIHPFPTAQWHAIEKKYGDKVPYYWVQEEHKNAGAWEYMAQVMEVASKKIVLQYAGRAESAATATGFPTLHEKEKKLFIEQAFN
ncbi:MAG: 2-oxoglutarate dehydrogenase E1 component [Chlamydiales bacterium]